MNLITDNLVWLACLGAGNLTQVQVASQKYLRYVVPSDLFFIVYLPPLEPLCSIEPRLEPPISR